MNESRKVLELTTRIGEVLLKNGGEIFRVQETMQRIAKAYGVEGFHVYVLANGIFASIEEDGRQICQQLQVGNGEKDSDDLVVASQIRYIPLSSIHLGRVAAVNNLSREIVAKKYTMEEARKKIEEIDKIPFTNNLLQIFVSGLGSGAFCYLLGGSLIDSLASFLSGILLWCFVLYLSKKGANKIMLNILSSALVTLTGILMFRYVFGENMVKSLSVQLSHCFRVYLLPTQSSDFLNGDYLSGNDSHDCALLVACCIALGVGVVLRVFQIVTGMPV